jgi:hypothetical protein
MLFNNPSLSTAMAFANLSEHNILAGRYSTFPHATEGIDINLELINISKPWGTTVALQ